jgi:tetratricopeptide (TPR) repeat protein
MDDRLKQLMTLGKEHYQNHEYDKAERYLSEVVKQHRGFADVFNMLGVIFHDQGKFSQAQSSFEEALAINPQYTEAALNLAVTYNDLGRYQEAKDVYSRAMARLRSQPKSVDPFVRGKLANMHADLGEAYASVAMYDEAVREFQKALALCPTFVDIRVRLGLTYRDRGDLESATREFEEARRTSPTYTPARVHLGLTLYSLGRRSEACMEWEEVLAREPDNKRVQLYLKLGREEGATAQAMEQAAATSAEPPPTRDS